MDSSVLRLVSYRTSKPRTQNPNSWPPLESVTPKGPFGSIPHPSVDENVKAKIDGKRPVHEDNIYINDAEITEKKQCVLIILQKAQKR